MVRITCPWFSQARGESWLHRNHQPPLSRQFSLLLRGDHSSYGSCPEASSGHITVPEDQADTTSQSALVSLGTALT